MCSCWTFSKPHLGILSPPVAHLSLSLPCHGILIFFLLLPTLLASMDRNIPGDHPGMWVTVLRALS